jgi:broad specificity phosphatase PhoE
LATVKNPAFNERNWGILEGKTHGEVKEIILKDSGLVEKYPYLKAGEFDRIWSDPDFKVEGSESLNELVVRVKSGMIELSRKFPGKNILLITHAGVLQTQGFDFDSISGVSVEKGSNGEKIIKRS